MMFLHVSGFGLSRAGNNCALRRPLFRSFGHLSPPWTNELCKTVRHVRTHDTSTKRTRLKMP